MKDDNDIYKEIAGILLNVAPENSEKVKLIAEMKYGDDHCEFEYWATDSLGREAWFSPQGARTDVLLMNLLVELRSYFRANNLFKGSRPWIGAIVAIDISKQKISLDFSYE
ncbi:hypothetical protein [Xanthomonas sontii]|uniref:hypothetical protein n=1 Tax=Xanthomonas sontii TaxID=2650745 RepID=UPI00123DD9E1|nr:hypothetical protein [Xanthomonas sontii]